MVSTVSFSIFQSNSGSLSCRCGNGVFRCRSGFDRNIGPNPDRSHVVQIIFSPLNLRPHFFIPVFLVLWLCVSSMSAQSPLGPLGGVRFETPMEAAKALDAAGTLQTRAELLRAVAEAYLRAHAYDTLPPMVAGLPVPEDAAWQRTFLSANLQLMLGNADAAVHLLKQLPDASLRDPVVLKFRLEHPDLFGDNSLAPPPDLDSGTPEDAAKNYLDALEPDKAWQIIAAHSENFLGDPGVLRQLTARIIDQNLAPRLLPLLEEQAKRQPETMGRNVMGRSRADWRPGSPEQPLPVNEQIEAMFLGQSAPLWSMPDSRLTPFSGSQPLLPPTLAPALEKLAGDVSSPLHVSARIAQA